MGVTTTVFSQLLFFKQPDDKRTNPIGIWIGAVQATGDGTGGSLIARIRIGGAADGAGPYMFFTVDSVSAHDSSAQTQTWWFQIISSVDYLGGPTTHTWARYISAMNAIEPTHFCGFANGRAIYACGKSISGAYVNTYVDNGATKTIFFAGTGRLMDERLPINL